MRFKSEDERDEDRINALQERDADEAAQYGDTSWGRERARQARLIREGKIAPDEDWYL